VQTAGVCEVRYLDNYAERRVQQLQTRIRRSSHYNYAALQGKHVTRITNNGCSTFPFDQSHQMLIQMPVLHLARAQHLMIQPHNVHTFLQNCSHSPCHSRNSPLCNIIYNCCQCFGNSYCSQDCRHSICCFPSSAASAISRCTRTGCIQGWWSNDVMLLAQDADRCRYAFVHVRWHACVGVVAAAHIRQQAACTEDKLA
jgi:hypothetical protein